MFFRKAVVMALFSLNDYFALTYLRPDKENDRLMLRSIIDAYERNSVKLIYFAFFFDPYLSVPIHLDTRRTFERTFRENIKCKPRIRAVSVVPLFPGVSKMRGLSRLVTVSNGEKYIFITVPPTRDADMIISELHSIIYDLKYIPVITETEKAVLWIPDRAAQSLYKIPRAVYEINYCNLHMTSVHKLASDLLTQGKTVVFGSGMKFGFSPYGNPNYYTKLINRIIKPATFGYFTIRHNQVLR